MKVLAIDFDGTIRDWNTNEPIAGAKDSISQLREEGWKVYIHSCNEPTFIEKWMNDHDIRFDYIWGADEQDFVTKPIATYYIDDRGLKFESWPGVMKKLGAANG